MSNSRVNLGAGGFQQKTTKKKPKKNGNKMKAKGMAKGGKMKAKGMAKGGKMKTKGYAAGGALKGRPPSNKNSGLYGR